MNKQGLLKSLLTNISHRGNNDEGQITGMTRCGKWCHNVRDAD